MNLHIGQPVEQINPWEDPDTGYPDVRFTECGVVYTIRAMEVTRGQLTLRFVELVNPVHHYRNAGWVEQPFPAWNFRPIPPRKTDISELKMLLNPSPEECVAVLYGSEA